MICERDTSRHPALVSALGGHTIKALETSDPRAPQFAEYNCSAYALNLADSAKLRLIASHFTFVHADERFVEFLLLHGVLEELAAPLPEAETTVIYFDLSKPTHAGKLLRGRVVSKWGYGQLWEHGLLEVPAFYGDRVRYFRPLAYSRAEAGFLDYVRSRGIDSRRLRGWSAV